ncbi:MAG: methyltransferase domain-containing protein [Burkholderiales bacterium]|jgi:tRNA (cmo5U34)-methyltransferase|nr:methyltransferase domain-containing protein [Burkholderiales bacterium]
MNDDFNRHLKAIDIFTETNRHGEAMARLPIDKKPVPHIMGETALRMVTDARRFMEINGNGEIARILLTKNPNLHCTLADHNPISLHASFSAVAKLTPRIAAILTDPAEIAFKSDTFHIIFMNDTLPRLNTDKKRITTFSNLWRLLKPSGCLVIADAVAQTHERVTRYMEAVYGHYLKTKYSQKVANETLHRRAHTGGLRTIDDDLTLMKGIGFRKVDVLYKRWCLAVFCGMK